MKNLFLVITVFIAYLLYKYRAIISEWFSENFSRKSESKTDVILVRNIVQEKKQNNLGLTIPDLNSLENPIEYLRTNAKIEVVKKSESEEKNTSANVEEVREVIYSRFENNPVRLFDDFAFSPKTSKIGYADYI